MSAEENGTDLIKFTTYDEYGRIINYGFTPRSMFELQAINGLNLIEGNGHWDTQYIVGGEFVDRPANPSIINGLQITNIPVPSKLYINLSEYDLDESSVELDLTHPGEYKIKILSFPYLDLNFNVVKS